MLDIEIEEDIIFYNDEVLEKDLVQSTKSNLVVEGNLLNNLKSTHKSSKPNMYFDEDYFADLYFNIYKPSVKKDENGKIISRNIVAEREVLSQILLIVNAVINKYKINRFERVDVLQNEGVSECWKALDNFDPTRTSKDKTKKTKFFHYLSLVAKFHLVNLTKKDKESRKSADIDICPELESRKYVDDDIFFEDLENSLFDIIDKNFSDEKHEKYIDLASILMHYIRENKTIVGKNDLYASFREYGYKTSDFKKFIEDISPYKELFYSLA